MGPQGFHHSDFTYQITASANGELLSQKWIVDNYQLDELGVPRKLKSGSSYMKPLKFDLTGDGTISVTTDYPLYDLRYTHRHNDGVIWVRSLPFTKSLDETELRVLMRRFVDAMAIDGMAATRIDRKRAKFRPFATRLLNSGMAKIWGHSAYTGIVEISNTETSSISPDGATELVELVLVRTHFFWRPTIAVKDRLKSGRRNTLVPVLLIVAYSNRPEDFESQREEFHRFVQQIQIDVQTELSPGNFQRTVNCAPQFESLRLKLTVNEISAPIEKRRERQYDTHYEILVESPDLTNRQIECVNRALAEVEDKEEEGYYFIRSLKSSAGPATTEIPYLSLPLPAVSDEFVTPSKPSQYKDSSGEKNKSINTVGEESAATLSVPH